MDLFSRKMIVPLGASVMFAALAVSASERTSWNFAEKQTNWEQPCGITLIQEKDSLLLDVYSPDSRIVAHNLAIPCDRFHKLRITYRAAEFAGATDGELYYATDRFPDVSDKQRFSIPSLIADGKEHDLVLDVSGWRGKGTVSLLRLDLVNQAPGLIYLLKMTFEAN